jgi:hypothetical protein
MTTKIYIISHDEKSFERAKHLSEKNTWGLPTLIPTTFLLESYFYTNILDYQEYKEFKWVGTISHKAEIKMGSAGMEKVNEMLLKTVDDNSVDILGFYYPVSHSGLSMSECTDLFHPGLMHLIHKLLVLFGEKESDIAILYSKSLKMFYCNYFVARPDWMHKFCEWFRRIILLLCVNRECFEMCRKDSNYGQNADPYIISVAERVYGQRYFPMYVFLCERIIPYFFHTRGARVLLPNDLK